MKIARQKTFDSSHWLWRTRLQIRSQEPVLGRRGTVPATVQELRPAFGHSRLDAVPDGRQVFLVEQTQLGLAGGQAGHFGALWRRIGGHGRRRWWWRERWVTADHHRFVAAAAAAVDQAGGSDAARAGRFRRRPRHLQLSGVGRRLLEMPANTRGNRLEG